jgi:hypothetical protein
MVGKISDLKLELSDWALGLLFGRVSIGQSGVELFDEGVGFLTLLVATAHCIVEVALAFDVGILQGIGPSAKLARA